MAFAQVHNHTEYSPLDGLSRCREAAERAAEIGCPALAITDHGVVAGHPQFQAECDRVGIKPLFGMETYFVPGRKERPAKGDEAAQARLRANRHLVLLATGPQGLRDLWAASTEAFRSGFYHKPRMDYELLERYASGWAATSACLGGVVSQDLLAGDLDTAGRTLLRMRRIFGGRFYLEVQANDLAEQRHLNKLLAEAGEALDIPLIAASDAHYPAPGHAALHKLWMACQTGKSEDGYWNFSPMLSEADVREQLGYLGAKVVDAAIANTAEVAASCTARVEGHAEPPVFTPGGTAADDARRLLDACLAAFSKVPRAERRAYFDRLETEWRLVADKRLAGCYLIVHDVISWARSRNILVGPGRGSAAGSLMSWLLGITTMDPLATGLLFERFLTPGRVALPDFDMDFPSSAREEITRYLAGRYGEEYVIRVGTHMRYRAKGILNKLFSVLAHSLPPEAQGESRQVAAIIDEAESHAAGLGVPWEELTAEERLQVFIGKYRSLFDVAGELYGRLYSYGTHPAGLVISTDTALTSALPMRNNHGTGPLVAQLDFRALEDLGLLKLDFLTLRTLDTVQTAIELVARRTGTRIDPAAWAAEHADPQVWDDIGTGLTAGCFTIETSLASAACTQMKPRSLAELAALTTYIRPGPRNSGMARLFLARRAGAEAVSYPHPLLEDSLADTYGVMLYQEHVLAACRLLAGYDGAEADAVRKVLGKKLTGKIAEAGEKFVTRCVANGHDREQVTGLWEIMAEFGKYGFNRAHAYAYATLAYWTAWLKTHYPVEFLAAILSTLDDKDRMAAYAMEARRLGIEILPPDVSKSGAGFEVAGAAIRYGLSSVKGVGPRALATVTAGQPYATLEDFRARSGADAGVVYALARAGALDALVPSRRGLVFALDGERSGDSVACLHKGPPGTGPNGLPCAYDWANEPQPAPRMGKRGPLKVHVKPPPKRCTVACRRYSPPPPARLGLPEYPPDELWRIDAEIFGCWMHPAPFAAIERLGEGMRGRARNLALVLPAARPGSYPLVAVHAGLSPPRRTRSGSFMWWLSLATEVSVLDAAVFTPRSAGDPDPLSEARGIKQGTLLLTEIVKNRYQAPSGEWRSSWRLAAIQPLEA